MKVKIRSVLKTSYHNFQCFQDQQIIFPAGNTLCIKEIGKNQAQFICLNKAILNLYSFKPSTHKKGVFTAQKLQNSVQVAYYSLKGQRKGVNLTHQSSFFSEVQKIQLLVDEYDNSLVYGAARNKQTSCVFLCDISKNKVMALGFMPHFEDIKVDSRENMTLSFCGFNGTYNYIKYLRYGLGQWQIEQQPYKRISQNHGTVIYHQIIFGGRVFLATRQVLYIFQDTDLLQTLEIPQKNEITSILKIPKAFLVLLKSQKIMLYIEDNDEVTFLQKGQISIQLDQDDTIHQMQVSFNNEEVIIRTIRNSVYTWKSEHIGLDAGHSEMVFTKIESSCVGQKSGNISISTAKRYCMLSGTKNVTLWSLQKNQFVLSSDFVGSQRKIKTILTSAVSPDGNSFILAFEDNIKIYKILLTKFKPFAQFAIKRCQNIVYSHGGQLVACRYGKGINACVQVINLLRLTSIYTIKVQAEPTQILWNELDDQIIIVAQNFTIQIFKVSENIRIHNIKFQSLIHYARIDYKVRKLLVSTQNKISVIDGGDIIDEIIPIIDKFHYVFPLYGIYFIVSKNGTLYWSSSLRFQNFTQYSLFSHQSFDLMCRNSYLVAYSSFQDVIVLQCLRHDHQKRASDNDIVMVQRDQILAVFDKLKILESNFDMLQTGTQVKLQQQKNNYEATINELRSKFSQQISFFNSKFSDMLIQKLKQERQTQKVFEDVDLKQITNVNQLQKMFSRKLILQKQKYMNLEQSALEQKLKFQKVIYELQAKYHRQVAQIRDQYSKKLKEEYNSAQNIKKHNLDDKQRLQIKLLDLQEENQFAMTNIQLDKDSIIYHLQEKIKNLQGQYDNLLIKYQAQQQKLNKIEDQRYNNLLQFKRLNVTLQENINRINLLQKDVASKKAMLQEKTQIIKQLSVQISGLEKAKYVLSFRTTQIRKQLQPKESLIDNLKSELFKLDDQFKQEKKKVFELKQKIQKLQTINQFTKKQNIEAKALLKQKQRVHDELCFQIFMIINTIDQKQWNSSFVKVYQSYIKQDKFKNRQTRKKDNTSEEINRHLIHVEQSLHQISSANNKNLKRKQQQMTKKMQQNSLLIYELNVMRKNERNYQNDKKQMGVAIDRIKRQLNQSYKSSNVTSTRAHTAKSGLTKRINASRDAMSRQKSTILDINQLGQNNSKSKQLKQPKSRNKSRNGVTSANKTMMMRNPDRQQLNRFFQVARDLQSCRNTIKIQDQMIQQLNQRLFGSQQRQK